MLRGSGVDSGQPHLCLHRLLAGIDSPTPHFTSHLAGGLSNATSRPRNLVTASTTTPSNTPGAASAAAVSSIVASAWSGAIVPSPGALTPGGSFFHLIVI